jgi:coproporphyrinogen III oxidase-like Fe-S oxidoreductase
MTMHDSGTRAAAEVVEAVAAELGGRDGRTLGLYVEVPFCASKCHFCDWVTDIPVSRLRGDHAARDPYVDALCRQIRYYGPLLTQLGYQPHVMYWGGGTPTRLEPDEMRAVAAALDDAFDLSGLVQWSMETTPNDLSEEKLAAMRELGVNRVSVGVQSLSPAQLRSAGRAHSRDQALAAISLLRRAGIDNFNVDLISSFPTETAPGELAATLRAILALDPPHLSVYPYRATPKTVMAMQLDREMLRAWDVSSMISSYELAMGMLTDAGYYEYCHGYWVRHREHEDVDGNYKYDLAGDKIGFGPGTESVLGHHLLLTSHTRYGEYLRDPSVFSLVEKFSLDQPERLTALVGGALMTRDGVDYARFRRLTGLAFGDLRRTPHFASWLALLERCGGRFAEDDRGFRMDRAVIHKTYITHLAYTMSHGLALARG